MINELKGKHLSRILHGLRLIKKDPSNKKKMPLKQMASGQSNTSIKNYLLIDFYEWLYLLNNDGILSSEVGEWDSFIKHTLPKYREFINSTTYTLDNTERMTTIIEDFLDYDYLEDLLKIYEIFMREVEGYQIMFLDLYDKINNSTNPVALVPWSYGLNRLCRDIYIIEEDKSVVNEIVPEPYKAEGRSNRYKVTVNRIQDRSMRVIGDSPIKLFHFVTDKTTEDLLPKAWVNIFDKVVKREFKGYTSRLDLIKGLYSQYAFYGRSQIDDFTTPKIGLINYPFLLDGAYGEENLKESLDLTPMGELSIVISPEDDTLSIYTKHV